MKKLLTFLTLLTLFFTTAWAAEGDLHDMGITEIQQLLNNNASIPSVSISEQSYPIKAVTVRWRHNKNNAGVTIEVKVNGVSWGTQTVTNSGNNFYDAVFEGPSTTGAVEINFTNNTGSGTGHGTFYVSNVILTEGSGSTPSNPTCATPTFNPNGGTFTEVKNVTITSTEGSTIYYTTDNSDPTTDSESITSGGTVTVDHSCVIKAYAVKEDMDDSNIATSNQFNINLPRTIATIEEFKALSKNDAFTFTGDVVTTYFNNEDSRYIWIKDDTGSTVIYFNSSQTNLTPNQGDVIKGGWHGVKEVYNGLEEIKSLTGASIDATQPVTVTPTTLTTGDITIANQAIYGKMSGVYITPGSGKNFTISDGTETVKGYNTYNLDLSDIEADKTYDIIGVVNVYNNPQFTPVEITEAQVTKYNVTCNTADNGYITTAEASYAEGATVNVTVTPNNGYELATLVYNDGEEDHDIKDAKSFTMPAHDVTITATFSVAASQGNVYKLVESATDLVAGEEYILAGRVGENPYTALLGPISTTSTKYGTAIQNHFVYDADSKTITLDDDCTATPFILGGSSIEGWTFQTASGYLNLYADDNCLNTVSEVGNGSKWIIATTKLPCDNKLIQIQVPGSTKARYLDYNNSGSGRFAAYTNVQSPVALFKKVSSTPSNKSEAPVITPEATTIVGGKVNVTITAADGAAIYYTTTVGQTGTTPDVEDDDQLYTEAFDLTHTGGYKTVTAIAVENGKEPSDPVSKTYLFTSPEAPTFTPDPSEIQSGDFTVTINSNPDYVGAVIYYLLDPTTAPNGANDVKDNGLVYNAETGVPVTGHGQHTIYAIVDLNGIKSSVATATYTIFSEGDEGDWKLVTKIADIDEGREYIIVNSDRDRTVGQFNPVLTSGYFSSLECTNSVLFGPGYSTATVAGNDVTIFTFEKDGDNLYMKSGETYYTPSTSSSDINMTKSNVYVTIDNGFVLIKGSNETTRSFAYNYQNSLHYFSSYSNPTTNGNQRPVYMYYREAEPVEEPIELTLAEIISLDDEADGKLYKISDADGLLGVYKNGNSVWFTDEKQAVDYQDPMAANYKYYTVVEKDDQGNVLSSTSEKDFHQYNWIEVVFPSETNFINAHVKNLTGTYTCENGNPKLELTVAVDEENDVTEVTSTGLAYELNPYMAANFEGTQRRTIQGETSMYFFSMPKAQEYAKILWAVWDGQKFNMPTENNAYGFTGSFTIDLQYNITDNPNLVANNSYNFEAIIRKSASKAGPYKVYPTNLQGIPTAINGVEINGQVKSVKYVNVAGMVSDVPFQGVNIVVTEYTDGSRTTSKMLRK